MKFLIEGTTSAGSQRGSQFKIEVEAKSEKHARELALIRLGSTAGIRKTQVKITKVEKSKK